MKRLSYLLSLALTLSLFVFMTACDEDSDDNGDGDDGPGAAAYIGNWGTVDEDGISIPSENTIEASAFSELAIDIQSESITVSGVPEDVAGSILDNVSGVSYTISGTTLTIDGSLTATAEVSEDVLTVTVNLSEDITAESARANGLSAVSGDYTFTFTGKE